MGEKHFTVRVYASRMVLEGRKPARKNRLSVRITNQNNTALFHEDISLEEAILLLGELREAVRTLKQWRKEDA